MISYQGHLFTHAAPFISKAQAAHYFDRTNLVCAAAVSEVGPNQHWTMVALDRQANMAVWFDPAGHWRQPHSLEAGMDALLNSNTLIFRLRLPIQTLPRACGATLAWGLLWWIGLEQSPKLMTFDARAFTLWLVLALTSLPGHQPSAGQMIGERLQDCLQVRQRLLEPEILCH